MGAQADLSPRWAHMPFCWFCHEAAHFICIHLDFSLHGIQLDARRYLKPMTRETQHHHCKVFIEKPPLITFFFFNMKANTINCGILSHSFYDATNLESFIRGQQTFSFPIQ